MAWTNPPSVTTLTGITATWGQNVAADLTLMGSAWTAYTPTVTGFTTVTLTTSGRYLLPGKNCVGTAQIALSAVTTLGTSTITISLPANISASATSNYHVLGTTMYRTNAGLIVAGVLTAAAAGGNTAYIRTAVPSAANPNLVAWAGNNPAGQVVGDAWYIAFDYETT
jgi:hypothetical protein